MKKLHPIMFVGTGSNVGKSIITAAFCRIFLQDGYKPAPFKAQNMSLNSYATPEGLEIGRAQAVQAEAAGIACHTDMNPILLKPTSNTKAQIVLNGKVDGNKTGYEYFNKEGRSRLREEVNNAFDRLEKQYNPIVLEGAGSVAEINLRELDIVNMSMAMHANADVFLVADIDTGGVFASVYGSIMLLTEEERKYVKGIIINKFRGDLRLFESGVKILEDLCKIPVIGVVPYFKNIYIEDEDSVVLKTKTNQSSANTVNIAVILLPHLSNFTDFNRLERDPRVHLFYTNEPSEIELADIIIIPGSKNTIADLSELRKSGLAKNIISAHENGTTVMGICGGYQIMGQEIHDPHGVEGQIKSIPGLGLLPTSTTLSKEKITRQVKFHIQNSTKECEGYEIHMGVTKPVNGITEQPLCKLFDNSVDGYFLNNKCFGSYIHGILDNDAFIDFLLEPFSTRAQKDSFDYKSDKDNQYNKLADHVRKYVNVNLVYNIIKGEYND